MSMSMLKKSMAIVEEDMEATKKRKEKESTVKKKDFKSRNPRYEESAFKKPAKKTINDIRKEMESSNARAAQNVNKLLMFSKHGAKIKNAEKIFERIHNKKYVIKKPKPDVQEEESIFTEEDFANFEKELAMTIQ
ncbi:uncharacterized protein LOC129906030 [Episyrphus balteatus]|uniref:uncharacterized protein LOC129906030 n=1 Tax=Episyrphus balteatus TaxID=286459 RepID=UPI002486498F|nr:uncharacterized protein LOC129906030 [Episyrphus balteatus]